MRCQRPWLACLLLLSALLLPSVLHAQQFCAYRMRLHATNCLLLTDGDVCDLCYEQDSSRLFKCEPTVIGETCSGTEWKEVTFAITDAAVPDTITASNYLRLDGGTLTGQVITSNLGVEFTESDTNPPCSTGNFSLFADASEAQLKQCVNGTVSIVGSGGSGLQGGSLIDEKFCTWNATDSVVDCATDPPGGGTNVIPGDDGVLYYNPTTSGESDWWWGPNHDAAGDDDDCMQLRQSATPGSSVRLSICPDGTLTTPASVASNFEMEMFESTTNGSGSILLGINGNIANSQKDCRFDLNGQMPANCIAGGGGSSAFSALTTGTNTTATMTVGTGASLVPSGTGVITATGAPSGFALATTTCLSVSADRIYHDTDCDNTKDAGEEFIDQTGGTPTFSGITTGTNTNQTLTVGTNSVLAATGNGVITATNGASGFTVGSVTDPADTGGTNFDNNTNGPCWEASPAGTDVCFIADASEVVTVTGGTLQANIGDSATAFFAAGTLEDARLPSSLADKVITGSLQVPNGTAPTVDAAGELAVDTTAGQLIYHNGTAVRVASDLDFKSITIETPASTDDILFFRAPRNLTITGIDCLVIGGTSAAVVVNECDANGGTCQAIEASITCGLTNTTESGGIDNAGIDAGDWIRVDVGTVTGSVTQLAITIEYTETRQ